jgi:hypothetical protein
MGDGSTWFKSRVEEDTPGDGDVLLEVGGSVERERQREKVARYHRFIMECVPERPKRQETNRVQDVVRRCGD